MEEVNKIKAAFKSFEEKCGSDNQHFASDAKKIREEIEKLWFDLEDLEKKREEDIQFRIKMIDMKKKYLVDAEEWTKWTVAKAAEHDKRDFDHHNSKQIGELIQQLQTYHKSEKPPK